MDMLGGQYGIARVLKLITLENFDGRGPPAWVFGGTQKTLSLCSDVVAWVRVGMTCFE